MATTTTTGTNITIIGAGTIGLSFAALHLTKDQKCEITIFDPRPDLQQYTDSNLPGYLLDVDYNSSCKPRLHFAQTLAEAVRSADIVQEQGPESKEFKVSLWPEIERHAPATALFWSSTSGIPASVQSANMRDRSRLLVVHPFNPPHVMPLLELVRAPGTAEEVVERTVEFWKERGRAPVVVKKECAGFVANRLSFALFREACSLVAQGVVSVRDLDEIVTSSMGPRWSVAGPFAAYHAGGGEGGLEAFMEKIGGTVQDCWEASERDLKRGDIRVGADWQGDVCRETKEAYGRIDTAARDRKTRQVLEAALT